MSLSKILCQKCNIQPLYHFYDESVDPILDEYVTKQEILDQYVCEQTPFEDYKDIEVFPDFRDSYNYTLLQELYIPSKKETLVHFMIRSGIIFSNRDEFIELLIQEIDGTYDICMEIKQLIQHCNWRYESCNQM